MPALQEPINLGDLLKYEAPSQYAAGVLMQDADAHLADRNDGLMVARHAIVSDHALQWPVGIAAAEQQAAILQLKALGVLVRTGA